MVQYTTMTEIKKTVNTRKVKEDVEKGELDDKYIDYHNLAYKAADIIDGYLLNVAGISDEIKENKQYIYIETEGKTARLHSKVTYELLEERIYISAVQQIGNRKMRIWVNELDKETITTLKEKLDVEE